MVSENLIPARCYFVGIGGVSMSALALLLRDRGILVRGSDLVESDFTKSLRQRGISVHIGESEEIVEDAVVYTGAVGLRNPQLAAAKRAGKRLISRAELLGMVANTFPRVLAIAGCHGKTTTTSMLAHIFERGNRPYACHIGGEDLDFGNYRTNGEEFFVTEACEFQRSFLSIHSEVALILNTDRDHTDCYSDDGEVVEAYALFAAQSERTIVNADDRNARKIPHSLSFGRYSGDIMAGRIFSDGERYRFTVFEKNVSTVDIRLAIHGAVHIQNALAAYAAARLMGFSATEIKHGIEEFRGVKRRFENMGTLAGVPVICDYAHHPREIEATLKTAERICRGAVRLVFQPHTYTRTRDLMEDFVNVLKKAENPIIYKTYAAREAFDHEGSAYTLASRVPKSGYVQSPEQLKKRLLSEIGKDDLILMLGAGDIYSIAGSIIDI